MPQKPNQRRPQGKPITLTQDQFTTYAYSSAGSEGRVASVQVPSSQVWAARPGEPLTVALPVEQAFTVDEGVSDQTLTLTPEAPKVPYLGDWAAGDYTQDAYIAGYFDSDDDGTPDTLITGSSTVQYTDTYTEDGGFITDLDVSDTSGNASTKDVSLYVIQRRGYALIQKRSSGKQNVQQSMKRDSQISWAFNAPNDPDSDKQVEWPRTLAGKRGVIPPKFWVDIVFFDKAETVDANNANASNLSIILPIKQRPVGSDESPESLRASIRNHMAQG